MYDFAFEVIVSKDDSNWIIRALADLSPTEAFYSLQNTLQYVPRQ